MQLLRLDSFAGKLFWMIMLGALSGVGGMAFLFSEMVKYQAEDQVHSTLNGKINAISSVSKAAETLAYGLGVSATTLHERQAQFPDTYRELTLQLFENRPEFVVGLGVGQSENGLIVEQPWLFPYYWAPSSDADSQDVIYEDLADDQGEFYPESDRYEQYFVPRREVWTEPYQQNASQLITYYLPLFGNDGDWLGTTFVDIDRQYLNNLLDVPVFHQQGHFLLVTHAGNIVVDPSNPDNDLTTYEEIVDLKAIWPSINRRQGTGFLEGETGYWAYASVPGQNWLVMGFVPYSAVFNRIALITLISTVLTVTLLSLAITLAVRSLNRRLRPVLNQCNQLAETDRTLLAQWDQQDDLNQLSLAFFNMLERLNLNAETIRKNEQKLEKEALHADQVSSQFDSLLQLLKQNAGTQQSLAHKAQRRLANMGRGFESVEVQLEVLKAKGRAIDGEFRRLPAHSSETLSVLEQQLESLKKSLESEESSAQLLVLADQAAQNIITLKAHARRWPALDNLSKQTRELSHAGQTATEEAQAIRESVESIVEMLAEIEQLSITLVRRSQAVSS